MRKPTICICENKDADQLRGNREADQRLCFRYTDSKSLFFLNTKFHASTSFLCLYSSDCVRPVRKPHCWFSHEAAQIFVILFSTITAMLHYFPHPFSKKLIHFITDFEVKDYYSRCIVNLFFHLFV